MPQKTDESEAPMLPDPELNPLMNPLLAAHMGRWAEVYFTNPPEKRGQAIAELLRELENAPLAEKAHAKSIHDEPLEQMAEVAEAPGVSPVASELIRTCTTCAHINSTEQPFCGMCGALFQQVGSAPTSAAGTSEPEARSASHPVEYATESAANSSVANVRNLTPLRTPQQKASANHDMRSANAFSRNWTYAAIALAMLLVGLLYPIWRGTKESSGAPQPATPSTTQPAVPPEPLPKRPARIASAKQPAAASSNVPANTSPISREQVPAEQDKKKAVTTSQKNQDANAAPTDKAVAETTSPAPPEPSGAEDLATAEKYLNGTAGATRDSRLAVPWLWKAVGKGNLTAAMALSDLYLRGDGVAKNCDQARLLLDAAARKGGKAAADRLNNLKTFGCQ